LPANGTENEVRLVEMGYRLMITCEIVERRLRGIEVSERIARVRVLLGVVISFTGRLTVVYV
jgi:hypothetical protein